MARIIFIEPYYGGSHRSFADAYAARSCHEVRLVTLPARKWKWRMRGAAMWLAGRLPDYEPDLVFASDYLDLATFCTIAPSPFSQLPRAVYFHENQFTYPVRDESGRDYHYGFINLTTCLAADRVLFNSRYNMDSFLEAAARCLGIMPDFVPKEVPEKIGEKSAVVPVGIDTEEMDRVGANTENGFPKSGPLHLVWNHRWEFDKGPGELYEVIKALDSRGARFRISIIGKAFKEVPHPLERIKAEFSHRLKHFGFVEDRKEYLRKLFKADVVISTAIHEFFGISVMEAVYAGCVPLLPKRLSYPEILPSSLHGECLYGCREEMVSRIEKWTETPQEIREKNYQSAAASFGLESMAENLDRHLEGLMK